MLFEVAALSLIWIVLVEAVLLVLASVNIFTYWSNKPEQATSFAAVRAYDNDFRSIVAPAIAALVTGLLVSLAASFIYAGIIEEDDSRFGVAMPLFIVALVILILLLYPLLRGELSTLVLAQNPQRIFLAARAVATVEDAAIERIEELEQALENWRKRRGAFSMGWSKKKESPRLNEAFADVPEERRLGFWRAARATWGQKVFRAAWRTAPWRFGWPVFLLAVPLLVGSPAYWVAWGKDSWLPLAFAGAAVLLVTAYWMGLSLSGVRRLSISLSFVPEATAALSDARDRANAERERRKTLDAWPTMVSDAVRRADREHSESESAVLGAITRDVRRARAWATAAAFASVVSVVVAALGIRGSLRR